MAVDYRSFSTDSASVNGNQVDRRWWLLKKDDIPASITSIIGFLQEHQGTRQTQSLVSARLYGNLNLMGLNGLTYSRMATVQSSLRDRISYNVCQSAVDTVTAKIGKNKPKPLFLTNGGDYKMQRRAKKLGKFIDGIFYENNAYHKGVDAFRDGGIWGDGIVHVYEEHDRVRYERVLSIELYVDEVEGFYGHPRQMHRVKNVDRQVLIDLYPESRRAIETASPAIPDHLGGYEHISDVVTVRESWHLRSGPDADDGFHVITIEKATLFKEAWDKDFFPFARFQWNKRLFGFWGQGLVEQIQNIQLEINKILWVIQRSFQLMGTFKVWLKNGSKIVPEHLNNDIGAIIQGDEAPQYLLPPIVQPELFSHLLTLKAAAYEQAGISQLSAEAKKPAGLDSGKALREFNDIESDRFNTIGHAYEQFFLELAKLSIATAKDIYSRNKKFEVRVPGKKFIESIDWKDIDLEDDDYVMQVYPVSSLPDEPAGRLQTIQEYAQAGYLSPRSARRLLDFPDLDQIEDLATAQEDVVHEMLEKIVEEGVYTAPEPYDDLQLCHELALEYYAQGKNSNLEEEKMDLLRNFIDQVNLLTTKALPPPQAPALPPGPQAVPQASPVSDLLPNAPGAAAAVA